MRDFETFVKAQEEEMARQERSRRAFFRDVVRFRGSILGAIVVPVSIITGWAVIVSSANILGYIHMTLSSTVLPNVIFVLGLLVAFRNAGAYDRWYDGRSQYQAMITDIRIASRYIWCNVSTDPATFTRPSPPPSTHFFNGKGRDPSPALPPTHAELLFEKARCMHLLVSFAVAVKHHLRREIGLDWEDYEAVLPVDVAQFWMKGFGLRGKGKIVEPPAGVTGVHTNGDLTPAPAGGSSDHRSSGTEETLVQVEDASDLAKEDKAARDMRQRAADAAAEQSRQEAVANAKAKAAVNHKTPLLDRAHGSGYNSLVRRKPQVKRQRQSRDMTIRAFFANKPPMSLPQVIAHELVRYLGSAKYQGQLDPGSYGSIMARIDNMTVSLGNMERISTTQIPSVYSIHLRQVILFYLMALPFAFVADVGWWTILFVFLISILLLGMEAIAAEIEFPFGHDQADLPLDLLCAELTHEVEWLMHSVPDGIGSSMFADI